MLLKGCCIEVCITGTTQIFKTDQKCILTKWTKTSLLFIRKQRKTCKVPENSIKIKTH